MDTKKLRQKLLDLAIRGKLAPQDPNDEPASELLARIHEEKLAMVERGELKPKDVKNDTVIYFGSDGLPYEKRADGKGETKCIADEVPFDLPQGWSWARLGVLGDWKSGATPKKSQKEYHEGGTIPWLLTGDLNDGHISAVPHKITELALQECSVRLNPVGSILVAMYGATIGKIGILDVPATTNQACCACIPFEASLTDWLFNWLLYYKPSFERLGLGGAQPNISRDIIVSQFIPIPPLAEQRRIVDALDKYLALVDGIERGRAELDALFAQLKSKVLDLAVRGELTERDPGDGPASELLSHIREEKLAMVARGELKPKDVKNDTVIFTGSDGLRYEKRADGEGETKCIEKEIPFEIPEGWGWARLSTLCLPQEKRLPSGERFNYIDIGSVDNSRNLICANEIDVVNAPSRASRCVHAGSILFSMVRPYLRNIAQVPVSMKDSVASTGFYVATKACNELDERFLLQLLLSDYAVNSINLHMKGDNSPSVRKEDMDALLLPIPPLDEQRRVVERAKEVFNLLN